MEQEREWPFAITLVCSYAPEKVYQCIGRWLALNREPQPTFFPNQAIKAFVITGKFSEEHDQLADEELLRLLMAVVEDIWRREDRMVVQVHIDYRGQAITLDRGYPDMNLKKVVSIGSKQRAVTEAIHKRAFTVTLKLRAEVIKTAPLHRLIGRRLKAQVGQKIAFSMPTKALQIRGMFSKVPADMTDPELMDGLVRLAEDIWGQNELRNAVASVYIHFCGELIQLNWPLVDQVKHIHEATVSDPNRLRPTKVSITFELATQGSFRIILHKEESSSIMKIIARVLGFDTWQALCSSAAITVLIWKSNHGIYALGHSINGFRIRRSAKLGYIIAEPNAPVKTSN